MAKFKEKVKESINARQVTVEEEIDWGFKFLDIPIKQTVSVGQWIVEDDDGKVLTTYHDSEFKKKFVVQ